MKKIIIRIEKPTDTDIKNIGLQLQKQIDEIKNIERPYFFQFQFLGQTFKDCFLQTIDYGKNEGDPLEITIIANKVS